MLFFFFNGRGLEAVRSCSTKVKVYIASVVVSPNPDPKHNPFPRCICGYMGVGHGSSPRPCPFPRTPRPFLLAQMTDKEKVLINQIKNLEGDLSALAR